MLRRVYGSPTSRYLRVVTTVPPRDDFVDRLDILAQIKRLLHGTDDTERGESLLDGRRECPGEYGDRDVAQFRRGSQFLYYCPTVFSWHIKVEDDEVRRGGMDVRAFAPQVRKELFAVCDTFHLYRQRTLA